MANLTVTATKIGVVFPDRAQIFDFVALEAITAGAPVYLGAAGTVGLADSNGSGAVAQTKGIALNAAGIGQAVSVLKTGHVFGYTLTNQAYGAPIFLSNDVGALADSAGTIALAIGQVVSIPDGDKTKVLFVDILWAAAQA